MQVNPSENMSASEWEAPVGKLGTRYRWEVQNDQMYLVSQTCFQQLFSFGTDYFRNRRAIELKSQDAETQSFFESFKKNPSQFLDTLDFIAIHMMRSRQLKQKEQDEVETFASFNTDAPIIIQSPWHYMIRNDSFLQTFILKSKDSPGRLLLAAKWLDSTNGDIQVRTDLYKRILLLSYTAIQKENLTGKGTFFDIDNVSKIIPKDILLNKDLYTEEIMEKIPAANKEKLIQWIKDQAPKTKENLESERARQKLIMHLSGIR